jgi:hypothetical protein
LKKTKGKLLNIEEGICSNMHESGGGKAPGSTAAASAFRTSNHSSSPRKLRSVRIT